ncbi:MAG: ABC transporter substrate-binding protein [Thermofilaceae archaeon]
MKLVRRRGLSKPILMAFAAAMIVAAAIVSLVIIPMITQRPSQPREEQPPQQPPAQPSGITLTVISRHPAEILVKARRMFLASEVAKRYNITDLKTIVLPPGLWEQYIRSGEADVAWGGGPTLFDSLFARGLLAPLTSAEALEAAAQIPDEIAGVPMKRVKDGKIYWVAAAISSFGFTVNHRRLRDYNLAVPRSWRDLASPELGRPLVQFGTAALSIADPTQSTSHTRMYEIILQRFGWEEGWRILTLMAANAEVYPGSEPARDAVIRGDVAVGITIDFYGYTAMNVNPDCEYIIPPGESIVNGDPIALVVGSKYPEAAQAFIAWVLTEGQAVWLDPGINRLPSNPRVFETAEGAKRPDLRRAYEATLQTPSIQFDDELALRYEPVMQWYFRSTLVDVNDYLKAVWKALLSRYFAGTITDEQFKAYVDRLTALLNFTDPDTQQTVTFTQEYAISIGERFVRDASFRDTLIMTWKRAAVSKYTSILQELGG